MPTCKSCNAKVLRTDAFCGTCGEPVPGAKPVVPIARPPQPSGVQAAPKRLSATFEPERGGGAARAAAVVALSEPADAEPPETDHTRTTIREASEPAPVLPLHRRKDGSGSARKHGEDEPAAEVPVSVPERDAKASLPNQPVPPGPPILASDLLREQMRPSSPGGRTLRIVTTALCAAGLVAAFFVGGIHPLTFVSAALLVTMGIVALTPMSYRARAISLTMMGAAATGVALWLQMQHGLEPQGAILVGATILLSGSLLFRAYYRGAWLSRIVVAFGVLTLGAWFVVSGGHESLIMLGGDWQSWGPAATQLAFGLLALLSLLAFMESSTRGGSHVWAAGLLVLYAVHVGVMIARARWPAEGAPSTLEGPTVAALLTGTVGTIVAGLALAQLFVALYQAGSKRREAAR